MSKRTKEPGNGNTGENPDALAEALEGEGRSADTAGEVDSTQADLAEKDKEIADLKDKYLRTLAESENSRKRIRQQSEESIRIQREAVLRDLLPIVDNLERAIEAARSGTEPKTIVDGVQMVLRSLLDFLRANGVTPLETVGQAFDPNRHEAADHVSSQVHPPNTVVSEFHRGYQMGERILRPARVSVSRDLSDAPSRRNGGETDPSDIENN
jgi:molecular chaperone GrpE